MPQRTHTGFTIIDGPLILGAETELTIATGAITVTTSWHSVDTEADAASDDLDTINGGADGWLLILRSAADARDVVVKHNTGNIILAGGADCTLGDSNDTITLIYDSDPSKWLELSRQNQ